MPGFIRPSGIPSSPNSKGGKTRNQWLLKGGGRVEIMTREIRTLEKSICELTDIVIQLTASINASKSSCKNSRANNFHLPEGPQAVCRNANCGVINSDPTICDHALARYQTEYHCG